MSINACHLSSVIHGDSSPRKRSNCQVAVQRNAQSMEDSECKLVQAANAVTLVSTAKWMCINPLGPKRKLNHKIPKTVGGILNTSQISQGSLFIERGINARDQC